MSIDKQKLITNMAEFLPKEASREEWERFHAYRRKRHMQRRPEDPIYPDDLTEKSMKRDDPYGESVYFYVQERDQFISLFFGGTMKPAAPGYDNNKHLLWASGSVLPEYRRQGIGTVWMSKILELFDRWPETKILTADTEEEDGHAFLQWVGADSKWTGAENRLKWSEIDWDMVETWVEEGPKRAEGAKLELYENRLPEELWEQYLPIYTTLSNLAPREDLDMGDWVSTPETWREMYSKADERGAVHHTMIIREPNGDISGLTEVWFNQVRETLLHQDLTGVDPKYRGRGLGKWLKAAMLQHARENYPKLDWVVTGNANSNGPMLSINHRLGFKEYRASTSYQIEKDRLREKIGA